MVALPAYLTQPQPTLEQQARLVEEHGLSTLLFCPDSWALRHHFTNQETGEVVPARCDSWRCSYCGPRKVDQWRQLVKVAEPQLFITFTRVGYTVEEASRVLTTIMQYLRRGSRGRGPNRVGARPAYPVEWFAVLERHSDFENVGFHWHVLVKGLDHILHEHLREALRSATHGRSYIVHVERVQSGAVGYVTKYLTKDITASEQGTTRRVHKMAMPVLEVQRSHEVTRLVAGSDGEQQPVTEERPYLFTSRLDEDGKPLMQIVEQVIEQVSKARRIRYSRHFFPMKTKELRRRLFSGLGLEQDLEAEESTTESQGSDSQDELLGVDESASSERLTSWKLDAKQGFFLKEGTSQLAKERYEQRRYQALLDALEGVRAGRRLSRRVINVWVYQQSNLRLFKEQSLKDEKRLM